MTTTNNSSSNNLVLVHISGVDAPGVTSKVCECCQKHKVQIVDIGQSVLHGYLNLTAILNIPANSSLTHDLLMWVGTKELRMEVKPLKSEDISHQVALRNSLCVTLIGDLEDVRATSKCTALLAQKQYNIREIKTLSQDKLRGIELLVNSHSDSPPSLTETRKELIELALAENIDIAIQNNDIFRRNKRMVCFDVDSTFVKSEIIDELAGLVGCKDAVTKITEEAMQGNLNFTEALHKRVALLKGISVSDMQKLCHEIPLTNGVANLAKNLKGLGFRVGLVSGGFDFFVNFLKEKFNLDFAFSNQLEIIDNKLSGKVIGSIVDGSRKAQILRDMAQVYKCRIEQCIAIGDGANDCEMLVAAGLGIAYRGKPALQKVADMNANGANMHELLFLLGYNQQDMQYFK